MPNLTLDSTEAPFIDCVIIPARGGSKRIPRKNLSLLNGRTLLERSIDLAKKVGSLVVVSSEDKEILDIATKSGALALKREDYLANDTATTLEVLHSAALELLKSHLRPESSVLCLYATALFANEKILKKALEKLKANKHLAYVVSVVENRGFHRALKFNAEGTLEFLQRGFEDSRTQDLPRVYNDAGQFYLGLASSFASNVALLGHSSAGIELEIAQDIDRPLDLEIAKKLLEIEVRDED